MAHNLWPYSSKAAQAQWYVRLSLQLCGLLRPALMDLTVSLLDQHNILCMPKLRGCPTSSSMRSYQLTAFKACSCHSYWLHVRTFFSEMAASAVRHCSKVILRMPFVFTCSQEGRQATRKGSSAGGYNWQAALSARQQHESAKMYAHWANPSFAAYKLSSCLPYGITGRYLGRYLHKQLITIRSCFNAS
jgi:hypothetical protein